MKHVSSAAMAFALLLGGAVPTFASQNSVTVFPAEGNKQCSDYSSNSMILQMGTTSPVSSGVLTGPENPRDADTTGESAPYTVTNGGKTVSFGNPDDPNGVRSTTPIDYALLKSGKNVTVIIYPSGGVTSDKDMRLTVGGQDLVVTAVSLCYGLGNAAPPPPPVSIVPRCEDLMTSGGFDGLSIQCGSGRSLVFNFELDQQHYNYTNTPVACICNSTAPLVECDPKALEGEPNSCIDPATKTTIPQVVTNIELSNDPYYCTTVLGSYKCYKY